MDQWDRASSNQLLPRPLLPDQFKCPTIWAQVVDIGSSPAMADTGPKLSAITLDSLIKIQNIGPILTELVGVNNSALGDVVGEVPLTVRIEENEVFLPRVVVLNQMVSPLLLGIDWLIKSGATITGRGGRAIVIVPKTNSLPLEVTIEDVKNKLKSSPRRRPIRRRKRNLG